VGLVELVLATSGGFVSRCQSVSEKVWFLVLVLVLCPSSSVLRGISRTRTRDEDEHETRTEFSDTFSGSSSPIAVQVFVRRRSGATHCERDLDAGSATVAALLYLERS
jgi:hypothetical protein